MMDQLKLQAGVDMSGTLVPIGTVIPAGTHQNLKIFSTVGYQVPRKFQKLGSDEYRVPTKFKFMPTPRYRLKLKNQMSWRASFDKLIKGTIFLKKRFCFLSVSILVQQNFEKIVEAQSSIQKDSSRRSSRPKHGILKSSLSKIRTLMTGINIIKENVSFN